MNVRQKLSLAALCFTLPAMASAQAAAPAPTAEPAAAPAPAAPATPKAAVTVGGTLNVNMQTTMAKGATDPSKSVKARGALSTDSSNIFVDANAEVAGGLKVIARCEASANVDGISVSGICNRNSRVGVSSSFGTLFYGNWDTPFKSATYGTKADDPFMNTDVFGYQGIMGSPGFNYRSSAGVTAAGDVPKATTAFPDGSVIKGFDVRAANSVAYHSPKLFGASVKLQYSASEFATADGKLSPQLFGAAVNYEWNGLSVLAAFERHDDWNGLAGINSPASTDAGPTVKASSAFGATAANEATHSSVDTAWRAGVGYQLDSVAGATTVSFLIDQLTFGQEKAVANSIKEYKRLAWQIAAKHRYGDHELRGRYDSADDGDCEAGTGSTIACSTTGYSAKQFAVGYAYHLSKSAQAYLSYTKIINGGNATYTLTIGGAPGVAGRTPKGADPQALGLGIRYAF